ncbi:4-oxalocrotonate tautomerase [Rhodoferax sp. OV413]|uniref:tautomerase family protein n=1 Tax=Rhodoferax sp. OV413 TaxID=1855285 RepID=UPI0008924E08|nr:tautomerase family protein [Rhodoferax sp. OV413]SDO04578.1 4-oxalocrotonate tautomerase [Rhodoferax sp. OV413]
MPYLHIQLSLPASAGVASEVGALLTELTASILQKKHELTAVSVEFVDPQHWFIGGASLASQHLRSFYLHVQVTEGTNTKDEKARYVAQVFAGLESLLGPLAPASYAVVQEVHADAWGYQGRTQEYRYVQAQPASR